MTREQTQEILKKVIGNYPSFKFQGTPTIEAWLETFKSKSPEQVEKALAEYIKNGNKYAPNSADLLKLIKPEVVNDGFVRRYYWHDNFSGKDFVMVYDGSKEPEKIEVTKEPGDSNTWIDDKGYRYAAPEV